MDSNIQTKRDEFRAFLDNHPDMKQDKPGPKNLYANLLLPEGALDINIKTLNIPGFTTSYEVLNPAIWSNVIIPLYVQHYHGNKGKKKMESIGTYWNHLAALNKYVEFLNQDTAQNSIPYDWDKTTVSLYTDELAYIDVANLSNPQKVEILFTDFLEKYLKYSTGKEITKTSNYIAAMQSVILPNITEVEPGVTSIFQVSSSKNLEHLLEKIALKDPGFGDFLSETPAGKTGKEYEAIAALRQYRYFLRLVASILQLAQGNISAETPEDKIARNACNEPLQVIYYGAPGTGKSYTIDDMTDEENSVRTTFHPDTDYSTFVGAYKPTMQRMPIHAIVGTSVHHAKDAQNQAAYEQKIVYKYVPQAFLKAYVEAWRIYPKPYYLIIEEINRGNCAQIFGDLFQLLDRNNSGCSAYAIHADGDIAQFLENDGNGFKKLVDSERKAIADYKLVKDNGDSIAIGADILSGKKLLLPPNLRIWATMNTSDQSLFPIDSAFKRRWNWKYVPINLHPVDKHGAAIEWQFQVGGKRYMWSDFLGKINPKIYELTLSSDKQIGYFFAKPDEKTSANESSNNLISESIFLNKVLFYLWTDVLKDFETGDPMFKDGETGKMYIFADFFEHHDKLTAFVDGLGLTPAGDEAAALEEVAQAAADGSEASPDTLELPQF